MCHSACVYSKVQSADGRRGGDVTYKVYIVLLYTMGDGYDVSIKFRADEYIKRGRAAIMTLTKGSATLVLILYY